MQAAEGAVPRDDLQPPTRLNTHAPNVISRGRVPRRSLIAYATVCRYATVTHLSGTTFHPTLLLFLDVSDENDMFLAQRKHVQKHVQCADERSHSTTKGGLCIVRRPEKRREEMWGSSCERWLRRRAASAGRREVPVRVGGGCRVWVLMFTRKLQEGCRVCVCIQRRLGERRKPR